MTLHATLPAPRQPLEIRPRARRVPRWLAAFVAFFFAASILAYFCRFDLRAYSVLTHFTNPNASGPLLRFLTRPVTESAVTVTWSSGSASVPARLYLPVGIAHPPGIVVVHGIHHLGIDDPRFINFSHALAASGFAVLTPVVSALADYHVDSASIATIGSSPAWLQQRLGTGPVTMITLSFSGGPALLAACDPQYAPHIRSLVLFGSYDDLYRVSRFLATGIEEFPDGHSILFAPHDYGASVFVYAHLEQFFSPADLPAAHDALKFWLWEQPDNATPFLTKLSPPGRAILDALMARRIDLVRSQLLAAIDADRPALDALSPHGHIAALRLPVYIVHGAGDNVIPPAESLWLKREVPPQDLRAVLITPAFSHVDPQQHVTLVDELRLVHFIGEILRTAS
jgi:pimeloyl-ACP methyl ester carboxylesterase